MWQRGCWKERQKVCPVPFRANFLFILLHYSLNIYEVCVLASASRFVTYFLGFSSVLFLFLAPCSLFVCLSVFSFCLLTPNTNFVLFGDQRNCCTLRFYARSRLSCFRFIYFMTRDAVANIWESVSMFIYIVCVYVGQLLGACILL